MSQSLNTGQKKNVLSATELFKDFLKKAPINFSAPLQKDSKKEILTHCYNSLWNDNEVFMKKYFFAQGLADNNYLSQLIEKHNLPDSNASAASNSFKNIEQSLNEDSAYWESQKGKQCDHLFKKGENVYRCRTCALDDTCVMCSRCFHSSNHEGHDIKTYISKGNGGCCDCGDPEAWKIPFDCSIHTLIENSENNLSSDKPKLEKISEVPLALINSIRETIVIILDYVLETFGVSPEDGTKMNSIMYIKNYWNEAHISLGLPVNNPDQTYECVLWNDDTHSYDAVTDQLKLALGCSDSEAKRITEFIDKYGRHSVKKSKVINDLLTCAETLGKIGLAVTISSSQVFTRETICGLLLEWLVGLVSGRCMLFSNVEEGNCIIRDIVCEILTEEWSLTYSIAAMSVSNKRKRSILDSWHPSFITSSNDENENENQDDMIGDEDEDVDNNIQLMNFIPDDLNIDEVPDDDEISILTDEIDHNVENLLGSDMNHPNLDDLTDEEIDRIYGGNISDDSEDDEDDDYDNHSFDSQSDIYDYMDEENEIEVSDESNYHADEISTPHQEQVRSEEYQSHEATQISTIDLSPKTEDISDLRWDLNQWIHNEIELEVQENIFALQFGAPSKDAILSDYDKSKITDSGKKFKEEFLRKLRLDYIMLYDLRLWTSARASITDLLIGTVISNLKYRPLLGMRFARNYPELMENYIFNDRETESSIMGLSIQILAVPTVAALLVKECKFFQMVTCIVQHFFSDQTNYVLPTQKTPKSQIDLTSKASKNSRYAYLVRDLVFVLSAEPAKSEISSNPIYLRHLLDMIYQFHEMDSFLRQEDTHIEFESSTWVFLFNLMYQITKICSLFAESFDKTQLSQPENARNLCCAISRVLKEIQNWELQTDAKHTNPKMAIRGLRQQKFHNMSACNTSSYSIVEYNIAKEPISFHHSFHWLLSQLLQNAVFISQDTYDKLGWLGGLSQIIHDAFHPVDYSIGSHSKSEGSSSFLVALEFPIRTLVYLSQVNCGAWVRNGFNVRSQVYSYSSVQFRLNMLDSDIFLLQVGLAICDSNEILLTLIDRFQLVDWFNGKYKKHKCYDPDQMTYVIDDLLNLLIVCVTEHGLVSGIPNEQLARQSIIQYLGISSMSFSQLTSHIPDKMTSIDGFESTLYQLATYKAPDGLNDKGLYELKSEYIDEINPYFWKYTRNQREEAHNALKKRWNELHPENKLGDKDEFLLQPKINQIQDGPFKHLGKFLHSQVFCQIIVYILWDCIFHKGSNHDSILDTGLYLATIAVLDPNSPAGEHISMRVEGRRNPDVMFEDSNIKHFVDHAELDRFPVQVNELERNHTTLIDILMRYLEDADLSQTHKRVKFILDKIELYGSDAAKKKISEWKEKLAIQASLKTEGDDKISLYEKKKAEAKARQAKIMSQFAAAQNQFIQQAGDDYESDEEYEEEEIHLDTDITEQGFEIVRKCHFPRDNCIVCQDKLDDSQLYGMLGYIQNTNVHRTVPLSDATILRDILKSSVSEEPWGAEATNSEELPLFVQFPSEAHRSGLDASSCGHFIHAKCFEVYRNSSNNHMMNQFTQSYPDIFFYQNKFACPLCKAIGNVLIPVIWHGKKETYPGVMATSTPYTDLHITICSIATELRKKFDADSATLDDDPPFVNTDPNTIISDITKLKLFYNQLMKVVRNTAEKKVSGSPTNLPDSLHQLYDMYANTIGDFEIAQRGNEHTKDLTVEYTGTFIDDMSSTSQTLLKILSMINTLLPILMNSSWQAEQRFTKERIALQVINQLIPKTVSHLVDDMVEADHLPPLLIDDPFKALVRFNFAFHDIPDVEPHHILRTMYIAELTKIILFIVYNGVISTQSDLVSKSGLGYLVNNLNQHKTESVSGTGEKNIESFTRFVLSLVNYPEDLVTKFFESVHPRALVSLVKTFSLPFLRKSLLFMVLHHGFIPQTSTQDEVVIKQSEFDKLLDTLKLPTFNEVFDLQTEDKEFVESWCSDYVSHVDLTPTDIHKALPEIELNLPTKYRMTTLPDRMYKLIDESQKHVCKKCKTIPEQSAICLLCGTFLCAQQLCCYENNKGECNIHMESCGGDVGVFFVIKKCYILLLHDKGGFIMNAPYLDHHGEPDLFLKRGSQQYLNLKRYEQIRQLWLTHSIPSFIKRKMETSNRDTLWERF